MAASARLAHIILEQESRDSGPAVAADIAVVHRMINPGKIDLERIEVQTGSYLGEDDVIRIEDVCNRYEIDIDELRRQSCAGSAQVLYVDHQVANWPR